MNMVHGHDNAVEVSFNQLLIRVPKAPSYLDFFHSRQMSQSFGVEEVVGHILTVLMLSQFWCQNWHND